jgi:hypothetical protein
VPRGAGREHLIQTPVPISFRIPPAQHFPRAGPILTQLPSSSSLRRLYLEWVEEQIEDYKERVPRSDLLRIADEVVADLQVNRKGQYQLTEMLLLEEVDRTLFRRLKLPTFRTWSAAYLERTRREKETREVPEAQPASV